MTPNYRPDIDGLRAIAVLSVLFFHAGIGLFSGGYVGVDVFFVISGYLITTIIVREIADGRFSLARFYERRFRRILPALTVVTVVSLLVGVWLFDPDNLEDLGKSAATAALFSSNILFYLQSGYFDGPAEMKPLLHTWSLAVEEQYYIFFPLLLLFIAKRNGGAYMWPLLAISLVSLTASVVLTPFAPSAAFYLIPTRAWELFIGSLLALRLVEPPRGQVVRELVASTGLLMILVSVFFYSSETMFPGFAAALPTLGAAMVIHAGSGGASLVSRLLGLGPLVFVGLISYSLYLWHWPILVFAKYYAITGLSDGQTGAVITLTFILAILSWRYVETPFRKRSPASSNRRVLVVAGGTLTALLLAGSVLVTTDGLGQRFEGVLAAQVDDPEWQHWQYCEEVAAAYPGLGEMCSIGMQGRSARFMLWGDSHARALASGIARSAADVGVSGRMATLRACPPLLDIERPGRTVCQRFNDAVFDYVAASDAIDTVILVARWTLSVEGERYKQESGKAVSLVDLRDEGAEASNSVLVERGLRRTVAALISLRKKVVLVYPVPEVGHDVPSLYHVAMQTGRDLNSLIAPTTEEYNRRTSDVRALFTKLEREFPITLVDPTPYLCDSERCRVVADQQLLYRDDDHLSTFGSKYVAGAYEPLFEQLREGAGGGNAILTQSGSDG